MMRAVSLEAAGGEKGEGGGLVWGGGGVKCFRLRALRTLACNGSASPSVEL